MGPIVKQAIKSMTRQRHLIDDLGRIAGRHPYYKYELSPYPLQPPKN